MSHNATVTTAPDSKPLSFDPERLAKERYLTFTEAAYYMGYRYPEYLHPEQAFRKAIGRLGIPHGYCGSRLRFERTDLDRFIAGQKARRGGLRHGA